MSASRKQVRDMKDIAVDFYGKFADVRVYNDVVYSRKYHKHDEGYCSRVIEITPNDDNTYQVLESVNSKDCDGRHSSTCDYIVRKRSGKRRRIYNYSPNPNKKGSFSVKSSFVLVSMKEGYINDQYARLANY